jgi:predicted transcriptional regulator
MASKHDLTEAEMDVLKALWRCGQATVRDVSAELESQGRVWAYSTVATLIQRLSAKGFIQTDDSTVPHVYSAAVSRDQLLGRRLRDTADELCDGNPGALLLALVQGEYFSPDELDRFRRILDEARRGDAPASETRPRSRKKKS